MKTDSESENREVLDRADILILCLVIAGLSILAPVIWTERVGGLRFSLNSLALIITCTGYLLLKKLPLRKLFRLYPLPYRQIISVFMLGIGSAILLDELDRIVSIFIPLPQPVQNQMEQLYSFTSVGKAVALIVGVGLLGPLIEEMIFRGAIQYSLEQRYDPTTAVFICAALFAVIHFNPYWLIQLVVLAVWVGYWVNRLKTVLAGWLIHSLNNLFGLFFLSVKETHWVSFYEWRGNVNPLLLLIALVLVISAMKLLPFNASPER